MGQTNKYDNSKTEMFGPSLKTFVVVMKHIDFYDDKYGYKQPLSPIFNALCRYCKYHHYGSSFSMDYHSGFRISDGPAGEEYFELAHVIANSSKALPLNTLVDTLRDYFDIGTHLQIIMIQKTKPIV